MKNTLLTSILLALMLPMAAMTRAKEPAIKIHSTAFQEVGESNLFSIFISTYTSDYYDVDLGSGLNEMEIVPGEFDSESGSWTGTWIPVRANAEGVITIYGNPENINVLKIDGGYIKEIEMDKCVNLQILSLQHNVLENLDLTPFKWLQAIYLSDNPFTGSKSLTVGSDHPNLMILELDIIDAMAEGFNLSDYPELRTFDGYHNFGLKAADISGCPKLASLSLEMTDVATLDVSNNPELVSLNIAETRITDIDISNLSKLQIFLAGHDSGWVNKGYRLNSIDLSHNPEIFYLNLSGNYLGKIDVTNNTKLTNIQLNRNALTSIDLSNNPNLYSVSITFNDLDYATLPLPESTWGEYYYYQNELGLPAKVVARDTDIDFSKRVLREGTTTTAVAWASPVGGEPYKLDNALYSYSDGIVRFNGAPSDSVYIEFINSAFADYTLKSMRFKVKEPEEVGLPSNVLSLSLPTDKDIKMAVGMSGATPSTPKKFYLELESDVLTEFETTFADEPTGFNVDISAPAGFSGVATIVIPEGEVLTSFSADGQTLYNINLKSATELRYLSLNGCDLYTIDLSYNRCLKYLDVSNNNLYKLNLNGIYGNYDKHVLNVVKASNNSFEDNSSFMLNSPGPVRYLDMSHNNFTEFDLEDFTGLQHLDLSYNQLSEPLDLSDQSGATYIDISHNSLKSMVLPAFDGLEHFDLSSNDFAISTLPLPAEIAADNYVYAPQNVYELPQKAPAVNLTVQNRVVDGVGTTYEWHTEDGQNLVAGTDFDCRDGAIKFLNFEVGPIYCTMTNPAYPAFNGEDVYRTSAVTPVAAPTEVVASFTTAKDSDSGIVTFTASRMTELYIDWKGDGNDYVVYPVETSYIAYPGQTTYAGAEVKVYTYESADLITIFSVGGIPMEQGDFSALTSVTCLNLSGTGLDYDHVKMPLQAPINQLDLSDCNFTDFPWAENYPNLDILVLSNNKLTYFDATPLQALGNLFLTGNGLSEVKLDNPRLWSLNLANNNFDKVDLSKLPALVQLDLGHNNFSSIDLSDLYGQLRVLSVVANRFTFSTLPLQSDFSALSVYYYGAQAILEAECVDNKVDLSQAAKAADGQESVYTWYLGEAVWDSDNLVWTGETLVEGEEYTIDNGVTTFLTAFNEPVMCLITNPTFPNLTMKTVKIEIIDTAIETITADNDSTVAPVNVYNINGTLLKSNVDPREATNGLTPGFYIIGNKKILIN